MNKNILLIDNDKLFCKQCEKHFLLEGDELTIAPDGEEGLILCKTKNPDVILLDTILPKKDGWSICTELRDITQAPIIFVSSKTETYNTILGLELGADDYIKKPCDLKEVSARIAAIERRSSKKTTSQDKDKILEFENLEINLTKYQVKINNELVKFPKKELELLYFLASNANHVFNRDMLLRKVWGFYFNGNSRTVDVHIKRVREKINGVSSKWSLVTTWGVGYTFETYI